MKIPVNLKHKPVFCIQDYENVDGRSASAKGISLGLAQWNDRGKVDIYIKVWRHTGGKWSRQSEEMPLHRVIDMALLICQTKEYLSNAYRYPKLYDENNPIIERIGLQGDAMTLEVCKDNELIDEDIKLFRDALNRDDELISERLHLLANKLYEAGYGRNIK